MRSRRLLPGSSVLALVLGTSGVRAAEPQQPCSAAEFRQFDFWLGEWEVYEDGARAGTNRIESILGGCALQEHWTGASGMHGTSLNVYSSGDRKWHQTWVDSNNLRLDLEGGLEGRRMVLVGRAPAPDAAMVLHRISWERLEDGTVQQHWQASRDEGTSWKEVFLGSYRRMAAPTPDRK